MKSIVSRIVLVLLVAALLSGCAGVSTTVVPPAAAEPTAAAQPPAAAAPTAVPPTVAPTAVPPTTAPATAAPAATAPAATAEGDLILATTTSTEDSGLLEVILPVFEEKTGVTVSVIAVGTGQALQLGRDGNADVLLVHARAQEDTFMEEGHGVRREDVMYNDLIIVGPESDPAGIAGMTDAAAALAQIAESEAIFVSRGDESGTHSKEKAVWKAAGIEPAGDWYVSAGQGMGDVLNMADEQLGYTLSDRATYLALTKEGLGLQILVEGDPALFNPYGVIAVNPDKNANIKADLANQFIDWIVSIPTQELIGAFGVEEFGAPLFTPDSQPYRDAQGGSTDADEPVAQAEIVITGMVPTETGFTAEDLQAMDTVDAEVTTKDGAVQAYTGVPINALLEVAEVEDGATTISLVTADGYSVEVALADVQACNTCIVAAQDGGGWRSVMPGFPGNAGVKDLFEIRVQ